MDNPHILFRDDLEQRAILFENPDELIVAHTPDELFAAFEKLENARKCGKWSAGYLSYEAGFCFEEKLKDKIPPNRGLPLLCFGIFNSPSDTFYPHTKPVENQCDQISEFVPAWDYDFYRKQFSTLQTHIACGDCYQGNLTFPIDGQWRGYPANILDFLTQRQPVRYGAFCSLGEPLIVSRSPELFFKVNRDGWIETHPMKGTAPRQPLPQDDLDEIEKLKSQSKTLAENVMIVDLLRNDISRIIRPETLAVPKLFEVETYPSVHQMISCVSGKLLDGVRVGDIFEALFPCGSITGAPKLRAMEILHELETVPRGIYCGAIGYIGPGQQMLFNVAIRTLVLFADGRARLNVGGGIIWDSDATAEYEEALMKAKFVMD